MFLDNSHSINHLRHSCPFLCKIQAKGWDPNDRSYDRKLEEKMKRLSPEDLSDLLSGEDIEPVQHHAKPTKED